MTEAARARQARPAAAGARQPRTLADIDTAARESGLAVFGGLHPGPEDGLPPEVATLVLLGPHEPGFWAHVTAAREYRDGAPDPLDRWSARVISALAAALGARAVFPFGGPPHRPFVRWALASGWAHVSPVGLLVHDRAGLMVSYRGALALEARLDLPAPPLAPCRSCTGRPCLSACPVDAFAGPGYEVDACKADLDRPGNDCMARGCAARRACPVSRGYGRLEAQSAFHMRAFR